MISRLIDTLRTLRKGGEELDAREIAEILWLAPFLESEPEPADSEVEREEQRPPPQERKAEVEAQDPGPETPPPARLPSTPELEVSIPRSEPEVSLQRGGRRAFQSPGAPALPHALLLARALRPLRRRLRSSRHRELDEVATAERIAREDLWIPVLRPGRARWLEAELVIDTGRSMSIWGRTLDELRTLLRYHGTFRDVRTWSLVTDAEDGRVRLYRGLGGGGAGRPERDPRELLGTPLERRLILVASDCVSPAWHTDSVGELLRLWGRSGPVAILQLLPQRVWVRTALRHHPSVWVHGREPGAANSRLVFGPWPGARVVGPQGAVPVPAVTLEKESLAGWARVVAGRVGAWAPGVLLREGPIARRAVAAVQEGVEPRERVQRFDAMASPLAQRMVRLFAAVPLSLPVMRLVWRTRLPEAMQVHLAEVFLGGLLEEEGSPDGSADPEQVQYDFVPGVREVLLESVPPAESLDTLRSVSHYVEERLGQTLDFQAMLEDPTSFGGEPLARALRPFARVAAAVLRQLGGEYAALAERLEGASGEARRRVQARARSSSEPVSPEARPDTSSTAEVPRWRASGKRVLVVGSGEEVLPESMRWLCSMLGQGLAAGGHSLVGRGGPGVEEAVGAAYVATLRGLGEKPEHHFVQVVSKGKQPRLSEGRIELAGRGKRKFTSVVNHADVVVLLQGTEGFFEGPDSGLSLYKPILSLPATGGDAARVHQELLGNDSYRWRSGVSRRSLYRLEVPVSPSELAGRAVAELLMLIDRIQPGAGIEAYARALLDVLNAFHPDAFFDQWLSERPRWRAFMAGLVRAAGMKRIEPRPFVRLSVESGGLTTVNPGDRGPALAALRATLPAMAERLLEDFERFSTLEEHDQVGCAIQAALAPLVLEFSWRQALDAVGELLSQTQVPRESPSLVSIAEAARGMFANPEDYERWLSEHARISPEELEFRQEFLRVADRLRRRYERVRSRDPARVHAALLAIVRGSRLVAVWRPGDEDESSDGLGYSDNPEPLGYTEDDVFGYSSEVERIESSRSARALVTPPNTLFVRHFLSSESASHRATSYLLIQQYVPELLSELGGCVARERSLLRSMPYNWSFALNRLFSCVLRWHEHLLQQDGGEELQWTLVEFLDELEKSPVPREDVALARVMERLSDIIDAKRREALEASLPDDYRRYARAMLLFLASTQQRLFARGARTRRPKWSGFLGELAQQAALELPRTQNTLGFVSGLIREGASGSEVFDVSRAGDVALARLQAVLPRMGRRLLADLERISGLEEADIVGSDVQTALVPALFLFDENPGLEAIGQSMRRAFDSMPSLLSTLLLEEARGKFPSEEEYRAWVASHLGISLQEYRFRQDIERLSIALSMHFEASNGWFELALNALREALPSNALAREPDFVRFFLGDPRPARQRAVAYLLIEEFRFTSLLPELIRSVSRELAVVADDAPLAAWQLLSCLRTFRNEPLLVEQWQGVLRALESLLLALERRPGLDPHGELAELAKSLTAGRVQDEEQARWERGMSGGDALAAQGDHAGALKTYRESLALAERLVARGPETETWRRCVVMSQGKVGRELLALGDYEGALAAHRAALSMAQNFKRFQPRDVVWLREMAVSQDTLGERLLAIEKRQGALAAYRVALSIRECVVRINPKNAIGKLELELNRQKVEELLHTLKP